MIDLGVMEYDTMTKASIQTMYVNPNNRGRLRFVYFTGVCNPIWSQTC